MTDSTGSQMDSIALWNGVLAERFERHRDLLLEGLRYHSTDPINGFGLPKGAKVVDVGCGWGDTAIELAKRVGPRGRVLGIDCCKPFLEKGRRDAKTLGLRHVNFVEADVRSYTFESEFDLVFSRFGMTFFDDPVAGIRNVGRALKPGGKVLFITWRAIEENPWLNLTKQVVLRFLPAPEGNTASHGPGPFSMSDPRVVTAQLEAGGFGNIAFERTDRLFTLGSTMEQAIEFVLAFGPAAEVFREAGKEAEGRREAIENALRVELAKYQHQGAVKMQSGSWTVTAQKPG
ncbi:MAG: methyltransferase domain-containing protein [Deltaproteobacteria bacterium]|nr:methyltransferase domain-containing protein [Deltaproteobacteria bacterium]